MSNSFIVNMWERVFRTLRYISVFEYVRRIKRFQGSHAFVEAWVIMNLLISIGCMVVTIYTDLPIVIAVIILVYSFLRVLEITVYQVNVLLFDQYKNPNTHEVKSYRRLVILLFHNYVEIIFWFAASYTILSYTFGIFEYQGNILNMILFSFVTMVSFGSNSLTEISSFSQLIIVNQVIVALFMTTICLARVIGLLPRPKTMDNSEIEEQLLLQLRDEIKHLEEKLDMLSESNK